MRCFIIHGAFGHPGENWFPWLKAELEKAGHEVVLPAFPTPDGQSLDSWMHVFEPYLKGIDSDTVLVGHSLGPAFILTVLERLEVQVKACIFVAGFVGTLGKDQFDLINRSFIDKEFDWEKIRANCRRFIIYHSQNDPYVPLSKAEDLGRKLGVKPRIINDGGHFNEAYGYTSFPQVLHDVLTS